MTTVYKYIVILPTPSSPPLLRTSGSTSPHCHVSPPNLLSPISTACWNFD